MSTTELERLIDEALDAIDARDRLEKEHEGAVSRCEAALKAISRCPDLADRLVYYRGHVIDATNSDLPVSIRPCVSLYPWNDGR